MTEEGGPAIFPAAEDQFRLLEVRNWIDARVKTLLARLLREAEGSDDDRGQALDFH